MRHVQHQEKPDECPSRTDGRTMKTKRIEDLVPIDQETPGRHALDYIHALEAKGYSRHTLRSRSAHLRYFLVWLHATGHYDIRKTSPETLTRYSLRVQRHRCESGRPLSAHSRYDRIANVHRFMKWLSQRGVLNEDPTAGVDRPRCRRRLPKTILTADEAEKVLAQPDVSTNLGLRDRAILETLYATGLRRQELIDLDLASIDLSRRTLAVRLGKGGKDRVVPIGTGTARWIKSYLRASRPALLRGARSTALFVTTHRGPISPERLGALVRGYVNEAEIGKSGSCHLFRHTVATLMLDGGADLRHVQAMLGHADISTTQIYTHVATKSLDEVHARCHPGRQSKNGTRRRKKPCPQRSSIRRRRNFGRARLR